MKPIHGHARHWKCGGPSREYSSWSCMVARCCNPNATSYEDYGGRGIKIAPEWRHDFAAFLAHVGPCPPGYSIDRIDHNGNYEPGNVRWASHTEQIRNRRNTRHLTYRGETACVEVWARRLGMSRETIYARQRNGWSDERIIETPLRKDHSFPGRKRHRCTPKETP